MKTKYLFTFVLAGMMAVSLSVAAGAQQVPVENSMPSASTTEVIPVTWKNFVRAESDAMFSSYVKMGAFGKFYHVPKPTPIDEQKVVRMNRDTIYSFAIFDLAAPVTITKMDTGKRFQSMQVINEDQYTTMVVYEPGSYTLTQEKIGTRYVFVVVRTLVDSEDPEDVEKVNAIQRQLKVEQKSAGTFEIPKWDAVSQEKVRAALKVLSATMENYDGSFGSKDEVNPLKFLFASATGWGGNPRNHAMYTGVTPEVNDGKTAYVLTVKDVPVDGFWSISLYNKEGYFQQNKYNAYSVNNITGTQNDDGSMTIHFGGDPKQANYLPIMEGWNYLVRLYQPSKEILEGSWTFPAPQAVK
ncbi:DUF1214 domain-containing protein [Teredinibacter franksiae]|uniref:DUF1214 domain-containing protein n=1 Tax=Teredinibacter franksiae TaxID=2761453 RepID=UPI001C89C810|nr:DUF1214 domain-containing protein [Teredinibacter franksiae]